MKRQDLLQPITERSARRFACRKLLGTMLGMLAATLVTFPDTAFAVHRSFGAAKNWTGIPFYGSYGTFFADVTGDGKADAIASNTDRVWFRRSDGCSFGPNEALTSTPFFGTHGIFFADVSGDGKADPIALNEDGITVRRSDDNRRANWSNARLYSGIAMDFADVDGDGKADAIEATFSGIMVRRSNGVNAFGPAENWTTQVPEYGTRGTYFADVTGDRRADAIFVNDGGVTVRRSMKGSTGPFATPEGFRLNETWTADPYYGSRANFFVDTTGDGKADAVVVNDDGIAVRDAVVNAFRSPHPDTHVVADRDAPIRAWGYWTLDAFYGYRQTFFADVDGDRAADAIAVNDDGVWIRRSNFANFFSNCP